MSANPLYDAIARRTGAAIIKGSETLTEKQFRFMVRVPAGPATTLWLSVVHHLLRNAQNRPWTIDISKHYHATPEGDLRYGWRIILQATEVTAQFPSLAEL